MSKKNTKELIIMPMSWWHIRKYFKSGHPALIIGMSESEDRIYAFFNITKNTPKGYTYIETSKPINNKSINSHIRLYVQMDKIKYFSKWIMKYELDEKDLMIIQEYLDRKKKKR